jgi:Leucine-rich repeat (LRR) protein
MQTLEQLQSGKLLGCTSIKLSCGLIEFPKELFDLVDTLELLDLSGNKLSSLPSDFGRFTKLKIAFFSDNQFTEYPEVLTNCPLLEMVGFKSNRISTIVSLTYRKRLGIALVYKK